MATKQLSDKNPDGTVLGQTTADKIAFYGVTPVAQAATFAALTTTPTTAEIRDAVNSLRTAMINLGFVASA
jgi:hypothetical protein